MTTTTPAAAAPTASAPVTSTGNAAPKTPKAITPASAKNDKRLSDLRNKVKTFGQQEGKGQMSRPAMAREAVAAAHDKVIGPDDAQGLWQTFQQEVSKARGTVYVPEKSEKQQVSKFRSIIKFGNLPNVDAVVVLDRAMGVRDLLAGQPDTNKGLQSPYDDIVKVARAQIGSPDAELTEEQITELFMPAEAAPKELYEELAALEKRMHSLYEGDSEKGKAPFRDPKFEKALEAISELATREKKKAETTKLLEKAAALGIAVTFTPNF